MKIILAIVVAALFAVPAAAQPVCQARAEMLRLLAERYREAPVAHGVTQAGALLEVLAAPDGATWSVIVSAPDGRACLVAAGEGWRARRARRQAPET